MLSGALPGFFRPEMCATVSQRTLPFAERLAYQRAIEEVYWRHRIWPRDSGQRPDPKPTLDRVMTQADLRKKVQDYLRKSQALEDYRQRPITSESLQAEMDRMAKHTKQPNVLRELFDTLGNDPFVIAECLARPVLTERLTAELSGQNGTEPVKFARVKGATGTSLATTSKNVAYILPMIPEGTPPCTDDTWTPTSLANAPDARVGHTAIWTGSEVIVWGGGHGTPFNTGGRYDPTIDTWTATSTSNTPGARSGHTAIWTGSEMIVWGGLDAGGLPLNTGGRYNPNTDSWTATNTTNPPDARYGHTAVWTGTEMIVWGGGTGSGVYNNGRRYNPLTDSWTALSTANAPSAREFHTAVWTGGEMIVWGGTDINNYLNTGGRYNPNNDTWAATSNNNAPDGRELHTAVWTGSEMIAWGGFAGASSGMNTGARYDPNTDNWLATSTANVPSARYSHTAIWSSSEMIVWGGLGTQYFITGGRYNPGTNAWTATSTTDAPSGRAYHTAVWSGMEMIVWGGNDGTVLNTGGRYCAQSGAPSPTPTATPCASVGTWAEQSPYPVAVSGNAVASHGGNVYSFGGIANNTACYKCL